MQDADYLAGEKKNNFSHLLAFNFHFVNILADKPPHFPTPPLQNARENFCASLFLVDY